MFRHSKKRKTGKRVRIQLPLEHQARAIQRAWRPFIRRLRAARRLQRVFRKFRWRCMEELSRRYPTAESVYDVYGKLQIPKIPFVFTHMGRLACPNIHECKCPHATSKKQYDTLKRQQSFLESAGVEAPGPCPFGHKSSSLKRVATRLFDDTCPRFMCIGHTKVREYDGRKVCQSCNQVFGSVRSELSYTHMGCQQPIMHTLSTKDQDIEAKVAAAMADFKDIQYDRRWPADLLLNVKSLCVKIFKVDEELKEKRINAMGDLTEEEKIKLRRSFNERMAQKNVMMASAAILWLSLVKDPERYGHKDMANEIIKMIRISDRNKAKKRIILDNVLTRINRSAEIFRRSMEAPVYLTSGHSFMKRNNSMVQDVSENFQLIEINARLATSLHIYGVNEFVSGTNVTQENGVWVFKTSASEDDYDRVAIEEFKKVSSDDDLSWAYKQWQDELQSEIETRNVELQFKAFGKLVYVVIQLTGGEITDAFSTYMPPQFTLKENSSVVDLMSISDGGSIVRVGEACEKTFKKTDLSLAREVTGNLADGSKRPVWVIDDPGILCKDGQVVLIKDDSSFVLGSQSNTYKCFKTEKPRNKYVNMIMEQLDHMDANCSVLGPLFHHHMPENFGKGHVINEIRHLLDTARDTFMDNSTHVNYNVHSVSCGFSHHRVSHKGPKIVTSFDLFRKEFFESCRTQAKVPQRPLKERYFKVGDEYTSTWTSKKGRVYTLTHKVMKVWSRNYIDTCFQNLLEDQQAFRNELTLRREQLPASLRDNEGPIRISKQVGRKLSEPKDVSSSTLWNTLDEFVENFVSNCVAPHLLAKMKKTFKNAVKGYVATAIVLKNSCSFFKTFKQACSGLIKPDTTNPFEKFAITRISESRRRNWLKSLATDRLTAMAKFSKIVLGKYFSHTYKHLNGVPMKLSPNDTYKILVSLRKVEDTVTRPTKRIRLS